MNRDKQGKFKTKSRGVLALIIAMAVIGVILYRAGDNTAPEVNVEDVATGNEVARLSPDVEAYMNSAEFKAEMELKARTDVLTNKRKNEVKLNKENLASLKAEYDAKVLDENDRNRGVISDIEVELEDIRKQELELGKSKGLKE